MSVTLVGSIQLLVAMLLICFDRITGVTDHSLYFVLALWGVANIIAGSIQEKT